MNKIQGVKVIIFGRGGCGKSTITTIMAKNLARKGYRILVIDSDESNITLYKMLGFNTIPSSVTEELGGRRSLSSMIKQSSVRIDWTNVRRIILSKNNIDLLTIGKIYLQNTY